MNLSRILCSTFVVRRRTRWQIISVAIFMLSFQVYFFRETPYPDYNSTCRVCHLFVVTHITFCIVYMYSIKQVSEQRVKQFEYVFYSPSCCINENEKCADATQESIFVNINFTIQPLTMSKWTHNNHGEKLHYIHNSANSKPNTSHRAVRRCAHGDEVVNLGGFFACVSGIRCVCSPRRDNHLL